MMAKSAHGQNAMETPTRQEVVEALRQVLAEMESGKLRSGSWREQYVASAIGLLCVGLLRGGGNPCGAGSSSRQRPHATGERRRPSARPGSRCG